MSNIRYQMYYSETILKKIDKLKDEMGFMHRSQTIMYLIRLGFDSLKETK